MSWRNQLIPTLLRVLLPMIFLLSGCRSIWHGDESNFLPHKSGRWTGRIASITLYARIEDERQFQGTVLQISGGPAFEAPAEMGGGTMPIITRHYNSNARMIPATELPVGKLVEVEGVMGVSQVLTAKPASLSRDDFLNRRQITPEESGFEHILILKGRPKVIDD